MLKWIGIPQIEPASGVYFDYLNWFLVSYSFGASVAVDLLVAIFAGLSVAYYVWLVGPSEQLPLVPTPISWIIK